jgi:hypothetical protein
MGRFASFDANRSYLMGALAQIDADDPEGAFATLTRCHGDVDEDGIVTPIDADHPDYEKYQTLDQIIMKARDLISSDPHEARHALVAGLKKFGWADESAAAKGEPADGK